MLMSTNLKSSNTGTENGSLSEYYRLLESKLRGSSGAPVVHDRTASDEGRVCAWKEHASGGEGTFYGQRQNKNKSHTLIFW